MRDKRWSRCALAGALVGAVGACADTTVRPVPAVVVAEWDPAAMPVPILPTPTDLARDPTTGQIRIPLPPNAGTAERDLAAYLASLDAFPSVMAAQARFSAPLAATSTTPSAVRAFDLTTGQEIAGVTVLLDSTAQRISVQAPGASWPAGHRILVAALGGEGGLRGAGGEPVVESPAFFFVRSTRPLATCTAAADCRSTTPLLTDAQASALEQLRLVLAPLFVALEDFDVPRDRVVLAWDFTVSSRPFAVYDPAAGVIPFPNDIARDPTTGRVELPVLPTDSAAVAQIKRGLASLAGFSTTAPIVAPVALPPGDALAPPGPRAVLTDIPSPAITASDGQLVIVPAAPLPEETTFFVIVTSALTDTAGTPVEPPPLMVLLRSRGRLAEDGRSTVSALTDAEAARLEPLRAALGAALDAAGIPRDQVILAWSFTTQPTLNALMTQIEALPPPSATSAPVPIPPTVPRAHIASLTGGTFVGARGDEVPYLLARPAVAGAPLVLFVHGLGGDATEVLAVADTFASVGFATVAFDLPLLGKRVVAGQPFLDLADPMASRDHLIQAVGDLAQLRRTVAGPGLGDYRFDGTLRLVGISIGGAVAADYAATTTDGRILLSTTGAPLVDVALESPTMRPVLQQALSALGAQPGTPQAQQALVFARWALDAGDPINYAAMLRDRPVLVQIASDDRVFPPDTGRKLAGAADAADLELDGSGSEMLVNPKDPNVAAAQMNAAEFLAGGAP